MQSTVRRESTGSSSSSSSSTKPSDGVSGSTAASIVTERLQRLRSVGNVGHGVRHPLATPLGYEVDVFGGGSGGGSNMPANLSTFHLLSARETARHRLPAPLVRHEWNARMAPPPGPLPPPSWTSRAHYGAQHQRDGVAAAVVGNAASSSTVVNPHPAARLPPALSSSAATAMSALPSMGPLSMCPHSFRQQREPSVSHYTPPSLVSIALHCLFTSGPKQRRHAARSPRGPSPLAQITRRVPVRLKQLLLYYFPFYFDIEDAWLLEHWNDSGIRYFNFSNSTRLSLTALQRLFNPPTPAESCRHSKDISSHDSDVEDDWEAYTASSSSGSSSSEGDDDYKDDELRPLSLDLSYTKFEADPATLVATLFADNYLDDGQDTELNSQLASIPYPSPPHSHLDLPLLQPPCRAPRPTSSLSRHLLHINISGLFNGLTGPAFLQSLSCYAPHLRAIECNNTFWITAADILTALPWTQRPSEPAPLATGWSAPPTHTPAKTTVTLSFFPYLRLLHCTGSVVCPIHKRQLRESMRDLRPALVLVL
ncbi:hypothetical protein RI367_008683 [Sorochytrium milnesiophthora]